MRRFNLFLRNGVLASALALGLPVSVPAVEPGGEFPPPVSYAPTDRYPLNEAGCRANLEKELPSAARFEEYYRCKIDFARLEHDYPLTGDDLKKVTPENIKPPDREQLDQQAADQEQIDQIYARLTAGPIPDGSFEIKLFRLRDFGLVAQIAQQLAGERLEPLKGLAFLLSKPEKERQELERQVWQGKMFTKSQRIVRTQIGDVSKLLPLLLPQPEKAGATKQSPVGQQTALLFPAKVYCGQSLLDGRRESIIIDYAFSHDIDGYREDIDGMMGPNKLQVRDEIRMVRPGFYLGRTYMGRIFVLNFILYNKVIAEQDTATAVEDCWIGSQRVTAASK